MLEVLARIRAEQRDQWQRGNRVPVEAYLERHPELAGREEMALDLIYGEAVLREELGETIDPAEYLGRFPQYAEKLRRQFAFHQALQDSEPPAERDTIKLAGPPGGIDTRPLPPGVGPEFPAIPGYDFLAKLGAGGPGVVYKVRQIDLNRDVALKMLRHDEDGTDPQRLALFRREAETVARLNHPNVVQIHGFGEHDGRPFFTMEYAEGGSLERRLEEGPLPPREAAALLETLARALHAVHREGIVHRDLKPGNVLLTRAGQPKVADFGLAKWQNTAASLTPSGAIVGTIGYMAPEQAAGKGREVTAAADVYALGAVLYHTLTGRPPFVGATLLEVFRQVQVREPAPPRLGRADRDLAAICVKCLEKAPGRRYASAEALAEDLRRYLDGKPTLARPRRWYEKAWRGVRKRLWLSAAAVLCVVVPAAAFLLAPDPDRERRRAEALLAAGDPYLFEGGQPFPGPFRWIVSEDVVSVTKNAAEGSFSLFTYGRGLLELVADPGHDHYRFSVELRHDDASQISEVGLFFGLRTHFPGRDDPQHGYYVLFYADRGKQAQTFKGKDGEPVSRVVTRGHFHEKNFAPGAGVGRHFEFRPTVPDLRPSDWRELVLEVGPAGVTEYWRNEEGRLVLADKISAAQLARCLNGLSKQHPKMAGIPSRFQPRAGLGLYVFRGKVSFRRIELWPVIQN